MISVKRVFKVSSWVRAGGLLLLGLQIAAPVYAQEKAVITPQVEMVNHSMKDQVKALRQQRFQQMPYLDKGYIRQVISKEKIQDRQAFLGAGKQSFRAILNRALFVHTAVRAARERRSLASRRILVAVRNLFPEANFEFEEKDGDLSAQAFNSMSYRFNLKQPLFRGGILWNTLLQEKMGMEVAEKEYDAAVSDLINDVSAAYLEYNRAVMSAHDQAEVVETVNGYAEISKRKYEQELISEIEHLNVQSLASQVRYDFETAKQEVELAKLELQQFLDIDLQDDLDIEPFYDIKKMIAEGESESLDANQESAESMLAGGAGDFEQPIDIPGLTELVDLAYANRPELQVEAAKLQSARLQERIRWGELLPQADFILEFGKLGEAFDANSVDPSLRKEVRVGFEINWNAAGNTVGYEFDNSESAPSATQFQSQTGSQTTRNTVKVGILDGLKDFAEAKDAEVAKLEQVIELEEREKEVMHDVKQSYYDYQKARIQVQSSIQRVSYRTRLMSLYEHRLGKNEIQISEYLQSMIDMQQELTTLHRALSDYFTAKARMNHAIGVRDHFKVEAEYESKY